MHAKYEGSISYGSKVIAKVKVDNRQTDKQTEQKQYAPNHSFWGHQNALKAYQPINNDTYFLDLQNPGHRDGLQ